MKPPKRMFAGRERPEPGPEGPEGLRQWALNFPDHWKAAYRSALKLGHPPDVILLATPHADRVKVPPDGFMALTRLQVSRMLPSLAVSLLAAPEPGFFHAVATKRFGRLQGSFLGMGEVPSEEEELPPVAIITGDSGLGVIV